VELGASLIKEIDLEMINDINREFRTLSGTNYDTKRYEIAAEQRKNVSEMFGGESRIKFEDAFEKGGKIGEGQYGEVFKCRRKSTGSFDGSPILLDTETYACKELKKADNP
jgi:hypothetical protein